MAVTMSLDDFSITYFTKGAGVNTLSTMLYAQLRKGIKPELYALSTILFFTVLLLLLVANMNPDKNHDSKKVYGIKRISSLVIIFTLIIGSFSVFFTVINADKNNNRTLTVLNYGKYIDEDALKKFEGTLKEENYEKRKGFFKKLKDMFNA